MSDDDESVDPPIYRFLLSGANHYFKNAQPPVLAHPQIRRPSKPSCFAMHLSSPVTFPPPQDININMLPFRIGERSSLPKQYWPYWRLIVGTRLDTDHLGKVGYLTIQESWVEPGECQRRPGLHTDRHPNLALDLARQWLADGKGNPWKDCPLAWHWGGRKGGIYLASNVANTTRVWDCFVRKPGPFGNCEHLRHALGAGNAVPANVMVWMTDGTPHEALPVEKRVYRQFIRVVGPDVHVWYADHSTHNPLCESAAQIVYGNKFTGITLYSLLLYALQNELESF